MTLVGQPERVTQDRVVAPFRDELGYRHLVRRDGPCEPANVDIDALSLMSALTLPSSRPRQPLVAAERQCRSCRCSNGPNGGHADGTDLVGRVPRRGGVRHPVVVGLGQADLANDEAIYSFGVDRTLETGDWLIPKSSPSEDGPFIEKPPLKMWIVAASIRAGRLPHNEFGLRVWDAAMGVAAFVYVLLLGARLSTTAGGVFAALILFVQAPLVFSHGLRSNNMELAQVLCHAGGMYHFVRWAGADAAGGRRRHAIVVGLYFVLGFMTKFGATLFLPLVIGLSILLSRAGRRTLLLGWRDWTASAMALQELHPRFKIGAAPPIPAT